MKETTSSFYDALVQKAINLFSKAPESAAANLADELYDYLQQAATLEHLLSMQYLYAAFSLKKYPEEFDDYPNPDPAINQKRVAQLEAIRRWEARILYVSRQEMEHLNLVQNLIVILGREPYLFRPNFPVPSGKNILGKPVNLMPFSKHAIEIFRYWEKPDSIQLPDPFRLDEVPAGIKKLADQSPHPEKAIPFDQSETRIKAMQRIVSILAGKAGDPVTFESIEQLYEFVWVFFKFMFGLKIIEGKNVMKVSNEHFGFNIQLDPIVEGKYFEYVDTVITQILEEGEGVWGVPPPLDSHFTVYQNILDELRVQEQNSSSVPFLPALPVVWNPTISDTPDHHSVPLPRLKAGLDEAMVTPVTNPVAKRAMALFNTAYDVLVRMLHGYFAFYEKDDTTGIRPPVTNAFFRTSFYPFMTMVIRPLGEILCRLPAREGYAPVPGKVPDATAGPNFFYAISQTASLHERLDVTKPFPLPGTFTAVFAEMEIEALGLAQDCITNGYHTANYKADDARDFNVRFTYLAENIYRIAQNFQAYWDGTMIAPIPSEGFQNFNDPFN